MSKIEVGNRVHVGPEHDISAIVIQVGRWGGTDRYECAWFHDAKRQTAWLTSGEVKAIEPIESKVGFNGTKDKP